MSSEILIPRDHGDEETAYSSIRMEGRKMGKAFAIGASALVALITFLVGLLIGAFTIYPPEPSRSDISQNLLNEIRADNIDTNLRHLSSVPHLAGTAEDLIQANWVRDRFLEGGLDEVQVVPYDVLLSYPDFDQPNIVYLLDDNGNISYNTSGRQTPMKEPEEALPSVAPNFNAYSGTGTAEGELVYVYYGREEDYEVLRDQGINVEGKIVLARYGSVFRGNIVKNAEDRKAAGVLIYSDPIDFAQDGRDSAYPDNWWMPGMAVQSGTVYIDNGDPLTPYYPSIEGAYRIPESEAALPQIPVQPIGYDEAEVFLRSLSGSKESPAEWHGSLNATYDVGPSPGGSKVRLDVRTRNVNATIFNTIGFLYGEEEPDRYVLIGNHRDAWILGSLDPSSGTASMVEMARAFGTVKKQNNWRPRRTLVFCSWGAEEYGLIGSYEWVEEHAKVLAQRAVAYLNVDIAVQGNFSMRAISVPMLRSIIIESAKKIPNPDTSESEAGRGSVFDTWVNNLPNPDDPSRPRIGNMGSGSDYNAFIHVVGVPCLDLRYTYKEKVNSYPLYHTLYETHYLAAMIDPGFTFHRALTQLWAEVARSLVEDPVLPFNLTDYTEELRKSLDNLKQRYQTPLEANGATFEYFEKSVEKFAAAAEDYVNYVASVDTSNKLEVRKINDQLLQMERNFIDPRGLPNRPKFNHIVFAPSSSNSYASSTFAGFADLMEAVGNQTESQQPKLWSQIKQHLSVIAFHIEAAATSLKGL